MFSYSAFRFAKCYRNGPFVSYLLRVSLIGFVCDFCYQNIGELPEMYTTLIKYLPTMITCYVYTKLEQFPF